MHIYIYIYINIDIEVPEAVFQHLQQYVDAVESIVPWHDKMHIMANSFQHFSLACTQYYPASMFAHDTNIGTIGVDIKVVAAYLQWLRFKGGETLSPERKVSTISNLFQQTKAGLRNQMHPHTAKPDWLSCSPKKFVVLKRMLDAWEKHDLQSAPVKSFLLGHHIEEFCLEAIWYHMQVGPPSPHPWPIQPRAPHKRLGQASLEILLLDAIL
jgi:hypothetical protein